MNPTPLGLRVAQLLGAVVAANAAKPEKEYRGHVGYPKCPGKGCTQREGHDNNAHGTHAALRRARMSRNAVYGGFGHYEPAKSPKALRVTPCDDHGHVNLRRPAPVKPLKLPAELVAAAHAADVLKSVGIR